MTTRRAACSCGQLRLTIEGEPSRISMCYCLACQRRTGAVISNQAAACLCAGASACAPVVRLPPFVGPRATPGQENATQCGAVAAAARQLSGYLLHRWWCPCAVEDRRIAFIWEPRQPLSLISDICGAAECRGDKECC